jgi:hypothetical protein
MVLKGRIKTALHHHGFHDGAWGNVGDIGLKVVADSGKTEHRIIGGGKEDNSTRKPPLPRCESTLQDDGMTFNVRDNHGSCTILGKTGNLIGVTGETVHGNAATAQVPSDT